MARTKKKVRVHYANPIPPIEAPCAPPIDATGDNAGVSKPTVPDIDDVSKPTISQTSRAPPKREKSAQKSSRVLHLEKVNEGLARLQSLGGQLNVDKCHIAESQVTLLGHVVSSRGIEADPGKVQALVKVKAPGPEPVEVQAKLSGAHSLYFDGAYKRKVDKASVGILIQDENGQKVFGKGLLVENTHSNNEAQYAALALGLEWCVSMGIKRLNVFGDALLLIKQVHGTWACRNQSLVPRLRRVKELMKRFEAIQVYHVPRKGNQEADALASERLQEVIVGAIKLQNPLFQGSDCMHDIVNFLETGECPQDMSKGQRQWLVRKATKYRLINEHLYCKGRDLVMRRVPHSKDIKQVLTRCHEGVCAGHFAHDITSRKILQAGYVWPSLHRDVQHWCKTCKQCQLAGDRHLTYEPQTPILSYGPFEKWGIDAIGPLPRTNSGKLYIIMGMDYMTRWAEATTSARITAKEIAKFVYESICCKFGVPLEILSDRGPGFRGDLVGELMKKLGIERRHSTPYYPQCNGLVEKTQTLLPTLFVRGRDIGLVQWRYNRAARQEAAFDEGFGERVDMLWEPSTSDAFKPWRTYHNGEPLRPDVEKSTQFARWLLGTFMEMVDVVMDMFGGIRGVASQCSTLHQHYISIKMGRQLARTCLAALERIPNDLPFTLFFGEVFRVLQRQRAATQEREFYDASSSQAHMRPLSVRP
ncbi:hypothetical protein L7F22_015457 [Adiantum nelumboides]|nr:hypothetical protein [Adiantum nelumboides]